MLFLNFCYTIALFLGILEFYVNDVGYNFQETMLIGCITKKHLVTQERLTNVYIPEGTSLLPPPPPPPHRPPPARPNTHDDFEPVTLHPFA